MSSWSPWKERGTVPTAVLPPTRTHLGGRMGTARVLGVTAYFAVVAIWAAFVLALAISPETLDSIWQWFRHLDRPYQVTGWIVLMPFTAGLAVWASSWLLAVKLLLIGTLALGTILGCAPRPLED